MTKQTGNKFSREVRARAVGMVWTTRAIPIAMGGNHARLRPRSAVRHKR